MDYLIYNMIRAAVAASARILEIYEKDFTVEYKADSSPLTSADIESDRIISEILRSKYPNIDILSEETVQDTPKMSDDNGLFIVDPLDGTKEFVNRNGEFCVSIGFSQNHRITAGVVVCPCRGSVYYAQAGKGSYKLSSAEFDAGFKFGHGTRIHVSGRTDGIIYVQSRSHADERTRILLGDNRISSVIAIGSCLKGCMIAEGGADVHYRFDSHTNEWDTAAMQIICTEAGAIFTDMNGHEIVYNRDEHRNINGFMILNDPRSALI